MRPLPAKYWPSLLESVGRYALALSIAALPEFAVRWATGDPNEARTVALWEFVGVAGTAVAAARVAGPPLVRAALHLAGFWALRSTIGAQWDDVAAAALFFTSCFCFAGATGFDAIERIFFRDRGPRFSLGTALAALFLLSAYVAIGREFWSPDGVAAPFAAGWTFLAYFACRETLELSRRRFGVVGVGGAAAGLLAAWIAIGEKLGSDRLAEIPLSLALFVVFASLDRTLIDRSDNTAGDAEPSPAEPTAA